MNFVLGTALLAVVTALACAIPGTVIVLRKNSMLVDARADRTGIGGMHVLRGTAWLAVVAALACALAGTVIVLRKSAVLVDAISHAVLPGIVVGYFFTQDLESPLLIVGAALAGLVV